jgi:predicted RNase H-like HicB family nuclease
LRCGILVDVRTLKVQALWDGEAGVWVAESDDVPGLATEAATLEELLAKLAVMVPELLEENGVALELPVELRLEATRPLVFS